MDAQVVDELWRIRRDSEDRSNDLAWDIREVEGKVAELERKVAELERKVEGAR